MKTPQIPPPWKTGIYTGNGVVATEPTLAEFNNPAWQETTLQEVLNIFTDNHQYNLEMVPFFSDYLAKHCTDLDTQKWLVYDQEYMLTGGEPPPAVQEHHTAMITGKDGWVTVTEQTLPVIWAEGCGEHTCTMGKATHRIEVRNHKGVQIHCFALYVNHALISALATYFVKAE